VIKSMMERTELPLKNEANISEIKFIFPWFSFSFML
jgi:hypothetical protein